MDKKIGAFSRLLGFLVGFGLVVVGHVVSTLAFRADFSLGLVTYIFTVLFGFWFVVRGARFGVSRMFKWYSMGDPDEEVPAPIDETL